MAGKPVFVSFDYENDRQYKYLLEAWNRNPQFRFCFDDKSSEEINSNNVGKVKVALAAKIGLADYTLVIIGKEANKRHRHAELIGYRNWINFEVAKSKECGNKLVAVKISSTYESPEELYGTNATWAMSFTEEAILRALEEA